METSTALTASLLSPKVYHSLLSTIRHHLRWPSIPIRLSRLRRKLRSHMRSRRSPASSVLDLDSSWDLSDTYRSLRAHERSWYDSQYIIFLILWVFALSIIDHPGIIVKTALVTVVGSGLAFPITRQFFLPILPIITWLIFFYSCGLIPGDWRPPIWVRVLPALENIFYGANLSNILSAHKNTFLDIVAWLPYGIIHFGAPFVCSIVLFICGPPGTLSNFAKSFGWMNIIGVMIQLLFPCSPPWYENMYGMAPANYSMAGSPAGLARLDALFGFDLYTSKFTASPMVFGAFPSLHSGCATIETLFMSHVFPQYRPLFVAYTLWLWWATMYLSHHYAVDLIGGSILSAIVFYVNRSNFLPRRQPGKLLRWDYDYVEIGDKEGSHRPRNIKTKFDKELDEWAVGSSSSVSSGTLSPTDDAHSWDGDDETLASTSDGEFEV